MKPLALCLVSICILVRGVESAQAGRTDEPLDIYWIDVEGGAATLIVTPMGESVLIDTGNPGHRDPDRIVQTAAREAGLRQLDHVIITHYHSDHFGGAATLATMLPIKHLHDNGIFEGIVDRPDKSYLECKAGKRSVISPGDFIALEPLAGENSPRLRLQCLGTRQRYIAPPPGEPANPGCADFKPKPIDTTDNANSVVTLLSFGPFRFFDAGDLTWNLEKELVCPADRVGKVDVYQASHHGMDASNNPLLIRALATTVAVINNGTTKGCDPLMFATLKETPSVQAIYQVHRNLRTDGSPNAEDEYIANAAQACKASFLKLSVDPTGTTFTMSVPSTGHSRTYRTH
ncbi:MAG: MBL fold metallo-hydrolase [Planctomycetia bacterium]|nr:MBL fold metallo-hydrolase [Planctomycetia bacterium]